MWHVNHAEGTEHIPLRLDKKSTSTLSGDSNTKVSYNYEASGSHKLLLNALGANSGGGASLKLWEELHKTCTLSRTHVRSSL